MVVASGTVTALNAYEDIGVATLEYHATIYRLADSIQPADPIYSMLATGHPLL